MSKIYIVCNNLLDSSRIKEALKDREISVVRNLEKLTEKQIDDGDVIVLDYYSYEKSGISEAINVIPANVKIISFVPHEKIDELNNVAPSFV